MAFAACGADDDDDEPVASPTATATATATATPSAAATLAAEASPKLPVTVTDKDGNQVTVDDVSRIVVLNGDFAEVVYALGLGENVVGTDVSATYPPEAQEKATIGYQRSLSAEGILSLNPTVIIGSETAGPPPVIEQIRGAGVPVVLFESATAIEDVTTKINSIAGALGVPNRGENLAAETQAEIDEALALAERASDEPKVAFLYLRGATTQMLMGRGSGADSMIAAAHGIDAGAEAGINGSAPVTPESLVAAAPDVILVVSAGLESVGGIDGLLQIPGVAETPAGQERRVIDMDDQYLLGLGPRTGEALMELVTALHLELS
jgi:iron complex transport system substrate-binding protein